MKKCFKRLKMTLTFKRSRVSSLASSRGVPERYSSSLRFQQTRRTLWIQTLASRAMKKRAAQRTAKRRASENCRLRKRLGAK